MKTFSIQKSLPVAMFVMAASVSPVVSSDDYGEMFISTTTPNTYTVNVSFDDLNLNSAAGQETLQRRLSKAARQVCGSADYRDAGSLRVAAQIKNCQKRAIADAMHQVQSGQLAAVGN